MKIGFIASECAPFIKTGGLADVAGALPQELRRQGHDVRVFLPKYRDIPNRYQKNMKHIVSFNVPLGGRNLHGGIEELTHDGITYCFVDNLYYFNRPGLYGYYDEAERFGYFAKAVLESLQHLDFQPDILHVHDWQTGMIPLLLKTHYGHLPFYQGIKTVFTIHNLQYQGIFPADALGHIFGLGQEHLHIDGLEFHGNINYMKAALNYADQITTVSPTYAQEIQMPYYGEQLDGLLRKRASDLHGILNGIDDRSYNPLTDPAIFYPYDGDSLAAKCVNKQKLQEQLGLPINPDVPLIAVITRFVPQKGIDLILHVLEEILAEDVQLVVIGTGYAHYEHAFREAAHRYPHKLSAQILFSESLARQAYAASDLFLMPSRFEPCGLSQLIALRYFSVPIVRETGGLRDTIHSYNEETGEGNGFTFTNYNAHDMLYTINRALHYYRDRTVWPKLMDQIAQADFSWRESAKQYSQIYAQLLDSREKELEICLDR
ncbi:glycogen synthase GlgA [Brevibacillus dissolubilis]|uniref:glycogen synthase GlgA n=1 Tax=Brevibacillus dissolubilis TaxID=1844116 RepID=UPI0011165B11|nr:glycogen synthase GlgA [Brevibacillus dissolubilis]